jgi:hypothetical protein
MTEREQTDHRLVCIECGSESGDGVGWRGYLTVDDADDDEPVEFQGYQYFSFPTDHSDFTETGIIGNPLRATVEKGEVAYERFSDHLAAALAEFEQLNVEVHTREFRNRS